MVSCWMFDLTVVTRSVVIEAVGKGLGQSGNVASTFNKLTHLIDDTCGGTLGKIVKLKCEIYASNACE